MASETNSGKFGDYLKNLKKIALLHLNQKYYFFFSLEKDLLFYGDVISDSLYF
jgi:hypothetical protein